MTNPATATVSLADTAAKDLASVEEIATKAIEDMKTILDKYNDVDNRIVIEPLVSARQILGSVEREVTMLQQRRNIPVVTMPVAPQNL